MSLKERYVTRIEDQLDDWSARLDRLDAKAEKIAVDRRDALRARIAASRALSAAARSRVQELKDSAMGRWAVLKERIDMAWKELASSIDEKSV